MRRSPAVLALLTSLGALAAPLPIAADKSQKLFPVIGGLYGAPVVELYAPGLVHLTPALETSIWKSRTRALSPGTGSPLVSKIVEGAALRELLAAAGVDGGHALFIKTFNPEAGGKVIQVPLADLTQAIVQFAGAEPDLPPSSRGKAVLASIQIDAGKWVDTDRSGWVGIAWLASASPFGDEPMHNLDWAPATPLFPNSEVRWKRRTAGPDALAAPGPLTDADVVKWEAGALGGDASVLRALGADGSLIGLYLRSGKQSWTLYDFTKTPPPIDPDHPRPDTEPAKLKLQGPYSYLLQIGDFQSPFSRLILIDAAGRPLEVPLRWGKTIGTGE